MGIRTNMVNGYSFILIFLLSLTYSWANPNYEKIDQASKSVPDSLTTAKEIAEYLTLHLPEEDEKLRALHIWITHNIEYDINLVGDKYYFDAPEDLIVNTLNTRKGVCANYARLFQHMCSILGIKALVIVGYTRQTEQAEIATESHAWNAVYLEDQYWIIDNTYAAGYVDQYDKFTQEFTDEYFLRDPSEMIKTHMPFDPLWQFADNPISHFDFKQKAFSNQQRIGNFNYKDTIAFYARQDTILQIQKMLDRIYKSGITNMLIQEYVDVGNWNVEALYYNRWTSKINELGDELDNVVTEINLGIMYDNNFKDYLNKRFRNPKIEDEEIRSTIDKANFHFNLGKDLLNGIKPRLYMLEYSGKNFENLQRTETHKKDLLNFMIEIEHKILEVEPSIKRDTDYVNRYLKKWKPLRPWVVH